MRWFIPAWIVTLAVVPIQGVGAWADEPGAAGGKEPVVVATWVHRVTNKDGSVARATIKLYSNGRINQPDGKNTWVQRGNTLILRWPNPKAPGGAWQDTCKISADGKTYTGRNQIGTAVAGKLVSKADARGAKAAATAPPARGTPEPVTESPSAGGTPGAPGTSVKGEVKKIGDLTATALKLDGRSLPPCLFWDSEKGEAFVALDSDKGMIRRISYPDFKVLQEKTVPRHSTWLSPSAEGLVLTVATKPQVWLLDARTLDVKSKIDVRGITIDRAVSVPCLSLAVGSDATSSNLAVIDLRSGRTTLYTPIQFTSRFSKEYSNLDPGALPFKEPTLSADGKYLFTRSGFAGTQIRKFHLDGGKVKFDEVSSPVGPAAAGGPQVGPDSKRVCLAGGTTYVTPIFSTASLARPVCKLNLVPGPFAIAFDPADGWMYAITGLFAGGGAQLVLFTPEGVKKKEYLVDKGFSGFRQCLVHPHGGNLLLLGGLRAYAVELPKRP